MRCVAICLSAGLAAGAASTQELPVLDPEASFFVLGGVGDRLVVESGAYQYLCSYDLRDGAAMLGDCVPVMSAQEMAEIAGAAEREPAAAVPEDATVAPDADDVPQRIASMTDAEFEAVLRDVFLDNGCKIDVSNTNVADRLFLSRFQLALGLGEAEMVEYGDMLEETVKDVSRGMVASGVVELDEQTGMVRLVDCAVEGTEEAAPDELETTVAALESALERLSGMDEAEFADLAFAVMPEVFAQVGERCTLALPDFEAAGGDDWLTGETYWRMFEKLDFAPEAVSILVSRAVDRPGDGAYGDYRDQLGAALDANRFEIYDRGDAVRQQVGDRMNALEELMDGVTSDSARATVDEDRGVVTLADCD